MTDQVKYTNKLRGKNVLIIGGSSGKNLVSFMVPIVTVVLIYHAQASATASQKRLSNLAQL